MRRALSALLLTILLTVTIGLPVFRHTCHELNQSELSVLDHDGCCAPFSGEQMAQIEAKCCSTEVFDTALDYETLIEVEWIIAVDFVSTNNSAINLQEFIYQKSAGMAVLRPPPLANRALLNRIQVYLI